MLFRSVSQSRYGEGTESELLKMLKDVRKTFDVAASGIAFAKALELAKIGLNSIKAKE